MSSANSVTFVLIDPPPDVKFFDTNGGILWTPNASAAGTSTSLKLKVTADGSTEVITIPVNIH